MYNPNLDENFSPEESIKIQAVHEILVDEVPENKRFVNPRDGSVAVIKQGAQGIGITGPEIAGKVATFGGMGSLSLTAKSSKKARFHNRRRELPTEENYEQYTDALTEIYQGLIRANGGMIGQNSLAVVIDFARNRELTLNSPKYFKMHGFSEANLPLLDFVDSPAAWAGTQQKDTIAFNKGESMVPYFSFLSDGDQLTSKLTRWMKKPLTKPDRLIIENGSAAGHNGTLFNREEVIAQLKEIIEDKDFYKFLPKYLYAGGMNTGKHLVEAIMDYGASGIQTGSRFTPSLESRAHEIHKQMIISASSVVSIPEEFFLKYSSEELENINRFLKGEPNYLGKLGSTSSLSAMGFRTPLQLDVFANRYQGSSKCKGDEHNDRGCLIKCGYTHKSLSSLYENLEKGDVGDFCIEYALLKALEGDINHGLMFAGQYSSEIPETTINTSVRKILGSFYLEAFEEIIGNEIRGEVAEKLERKTAEIKERGIDRLTHRLFTQYEPSRIISP